MRGAPNRIRFLIGRHLDVYLQDLGMCRLVLSELRPDPALYDDTVRALNRRYTNIALDVIREGIEAGELRRELAAPVLRDLIFGGIEHALWRFVNTGDRAGIDALGEQLADLLLRGAEAEREAPVVTRLERVAASLERAASGG